MLDALTGPGSEPFAVAALIMTGLVVLEVLTMVVGVSLSEVIGKNLDIDHETDEPGALAGWLGWLNAGGVPTLVLVIVALATFAGAGYALQAMAAGVLRPLPAWAAAAAAVAVALPLTRGTTRAIARIIPRDETYAIGPDDLVGRVGEVTLGPLDQGPAGRLKIRDRHGNWHFPMARPAKDQPPIAVGTQVLLVDRDGATFIVIPAPDALAAAGAA